MKACQAFCDIYFFLILPTEELYLCKVSSIKALLYFYYD